jgi:hypothetical protein
MGQFYIAVFIDTKTNQLYYVETFHGMKLTEHSYPGTDIVQRAENLLRPGGDCYGMRVVWAGDYADNEDGKEYNLYHAPKKINLNHEGEVPQGRLRYVVNHTKRVYVDMSKLSTHKYALHPLPILTAEGNGSGGGDYCGPYDRVGEWARDEITMENMCPQSGFTEIPFQCYDGEE